MLPSLFHSKFPSSLQTLLDHYSISNACEAFTQEVTEAVKHCARSEFAVSLITNFAAGLVGGSAGKLFSKGVLYTGLRILKDQRTVVEFEKVALRQLFKSRSINLLALRFTAGIYNYFANACVFNRLMGHGGGIQNIRTAMDFMLMNPGSLLSHHILKQVSPLPLRIFADFLLGGLNFCFSSGARVAFENLVHHTGDTFAAHFSVGQVFEGGAMHLGNRVAEHATSPFIQGLESFCNHVKNNGIDSVFTPEVVVDSFGNLVFVKRPAWLDSLFGAFESKAPAAREVPKAPEPPQSKIKSSEQLREVLVEWLLRGEENNPLFEAEMRQLMEQRPEFFKDPQVLPALYEFKLCLEAVPPQITSSHLTRQKLLELLRFEPALLSRFERMKSYGLYSVTPRNPSEAEVVNTYISTDGKITAVFYEDPRAADSIRQEGNLFIQDGTQTKIISGRISSLRDGGTITLDCGEQGRFVNNSHTPDVYYRNSSPLSSLKIAGNTVYFLRAGLERAEIEALGLNLGKVDFTLDEPRLIRSPYREYDSKVMTYQEIDRRIDEIPRSERPNISFILNRFRGFSIRIGNGAECIEYPTISSILGFTAFQNTVFLACVTSQGAGVRPRIFKFFGDRSRENSFEEIMDENSLPPEVLEALNWNR